MACSRKNEGSEGISEEQFVKILSTNEKKELIRLSINKNKQVRKLAKQKIKELDSCYYNLEDIK